MEPLFSIRGLVKSYSGFMLGPLDMDLEPGFVLAYVGPNGSGKTTTIHCMTGFVRQDRGEIKINGMPNDPDKPAWKLAIGYVGDVQAFYENWTGKQNLAFFAQFYPDWSMNYAVDLAKKMDLSLTTKVKTLSKGNRIKLALVIALAHSPKLLLLDEPTAGLDPVARAEVVEELFNLLEPGERSILYSTHILSDISRLADEIAFLNDGKLLVRKQKDNLIDNWRKISFRLDKKVGKLAATENLVTQGSDFQALSSDFNKTLEHLRELGAKNIQIGLMPIDEIAVQIIKRGKSVENIQV